MFRIPGQYFANGRSEARPAELLCEGRRVQVELKDERHSYTLDQLVFSDRLASIPRKVEFPDGSLFTTPDNDSVDHWLATNGYLPGFSIISFFEASWRWVLLAMVAIPLSVYLLLSFGMPLIAKPLAMTVPDSVKQRMDEEFIRVLDRQWLEASEIPQARQQELQDLFKKIPWSHESDLLIRKGQVIGANALALPGGTIIVTDEMVAMIEFDGEFVAVMAHELAHVAQNHSMRILLQSAGASLVLGWLLGDLSLVTDFVLVGGPTLLQQLSYSRRLEREADDFSLVMLEFNDYPKRCFSSLMQKLNDHYRLEEWDLPTYLSSHPAMASRIEAADEGLPCHNRASEVDWQRILSD